MFYIGFYWYSWFQTVSDFFRNLVGTCSELILGLFWYFLGTSGELLGNCLGIVSELFLNFSNLVRHLLLKIMKHIRHSDYFFGGITFSEESDHLESNRSDSNRIKSEASPTRIESNRIESNRIRSNRVTSNHAE